MTAENQANIRIPALLLEPTLNTFFPRVLCIENTLKALLKVNPIPNL